LFLAAEKNNDQVTHSSKIVGPRNPSLARLCRPGLRNSHRSRANTHGAFVGFASIKIFCRSFIKGQRQIISFT
jgi:hypothetical protein